MNAPASIVSSPVLRPETKIYGVGLGELALADPRLARSFALRPDLFGTCTPACGWGGIEWVNIAGCFTSGAIQTVQGEVCGITTDLWVRFIKYTVRRPNAFAGNILKAQSDYFNSLNPNIDFTLIIKSRCKYILSPDPTPLENITDVFDCICPVGFEIGCSAILQAEFTNKREFAADEVPVEVVVTLGTIPLPTPYEACSQIEAVSELAARGLLPSDCAKGY